MSNSKNIHDFYPDIDLAQNNDLQDILNLQTANLGKNLSIEEKEKFGFVSVETTIDLLETIAYEEGITVAKDNNKLIGYLMPISIDQGKQIPLLDPFIERFQNINFEGKPLNDYKYCILGQTCIDKEYRGKGVLEKLYKELQNRLSHKYDLGISEIGANNSRSLYTHVEKIGLQIIETYIADGKERHVVVLDFRKFR